MVILNSLFPVFCLILLGVVLKRYRLTTATYLQTSDRLVYSIFFPLMLFWKIGSSSFEDDIRWEVYFAVLAALGVMILLSIVLIVWRKIPAYQAGSFAQSCYRFNTYIGVAVILNGIGEEGIRYFGILIALAIPLINIAAVGTLIWYSQQKVYGKSRLRLLGKALLSNPLIIGCVAGLIYSQLFDGFVSFIDKSLALVAMLTLPLALISIGGSLSFGGLRRNFPLAVVSASVKLAIFPTVGYFFLQIFGVTGLPFTVAMVFFTLPTSTAIYILSSQMHSDPDLASAAIVLSTVLSFPALSFALLL